MKPLFLQKKKNLPIFLGSRIFKLAALVADQGTDSCDACEVSLPLANQQMQVEVA